MDLVAKRNRSVICLLVCAIAPASAQQSATYRDPQGRYTTQLPAGFSTVQLNGDAVQFANGAAYVTAMVLPGNDPKMTIDAIARQSGGQWRNFTEVRGGDTRFAGRVGPYATYSGTNPMGADSYLQMLAITDGISTYLLMTSAPRRIFCV